MKKINKLSILLAVLLLFAFGCGKVDEENEKIKLTISEGTLTVGTHSGYAPMEYVDENGEITGFDIELAKAIADELGLDVEIKECAWDAIFRKLDGDAFDVIISGVSYTEERNNNYNLTDAYIANSLVFAVPSEFEIEEYADVSFLEGKTVGVQLDTTADYTIQNYIEMYDVELAQYETVEYAFAALNAGKIDCVCADSLIVAHYISENNHYKTVDCFNDYEPFCICISKKNEALYYKVNDALKILSDNGKLTELSIKYFGTDLTSNINP